MTDYPQIKQLEEQLYSSAMPQYRPSPDTAMGPVGYPHARAIKESSSMMAQQPPIFEGYRAGKGRFKAKNQSEWWNLPNAQQQAGVIFVIPTQLGMFNDVYMRWESITKKFSGTAKFYKCERQSRVH